MTENPSTHLWDAAIIGGGHNGLVAASYLAKSGLSVVVLERREQVGGACVTEEIVPGYHFSRAAYVNSLFRPEIIRDLDLERHGYQYLPRNPSSFTPLRDGRSLLLGPDEKANVRSIAAFSRRDAERFPAYEAMLNRLAAFLEPFLDEPPLATPTATKVIGMLPTLGRISLRGLRLGRDLPNLVEVATAPAARILERWFESEPLRSTLATDAIIGAMASPWTPGSGYVLFHHVMGETDGARGVWSYVRGGMGALSESIRSAAERFGAKIRTDCEVAEILVSEDQAAGVRLTDGEEVKARSVLSGADPQVTFLKLTPAVSLPEEFRDRIATLDMSSGVTKINVALDRIPKFTCSSDGAVGPEHRGTIHICESMTEIDAAYSDACAGIPSRRPIIEMTIPSALDDSLAPPGKHVASLFVQYTPYQLRDGSWDDPGRRDEFADRVFGVVEEFAPGFTSSVVGRDVLTPVDLERIFGLTGGNIFHGAMTLDQLYWLRPAAGWARYRTPLKGLYLCGAGAHPGGGVLGAPGRNAARAVLADLP